MTPKPARNPTDAKPSRTLDADGLDPKKFPNLAAERDWDREQHIKQAMQAGMTRRQAEKHADDELRDG